MENVIALSDFLDKLDKEFGRERQKTYITNVHDPYNEISLIVGYTVVGHLVPRYAEILIWIDKISEVYQFSIGGIHFDSKMMSDASDRENFLKAKDRVLWDESDPWEGKVITLGDEFRDLLINRIKHLVEITSQRLANIVGNEINSAETAYELHEIGEYIYTLTHLLNYLVRTKEAGKTV